MKENTRMGSKAFLEVKLDKEKKQYFFKFYSLLQIIVLKNDK